MNAISISFMKPQIKLFQPRLFCAAALGIGSAFTLAAAAERGHSCPQQFPNAGADSAHATLAKTSQAIPWSQLGAKAGADYQGDGLAVRPTAEGARLRCVFQRLEGEATREGLWLTSTVTNAANDRFRVVATAVRRQSSTVGDEVTSLTSITDNRDGKRQAAAAVQDAIALVHTGMVEVGDKQVRFLRTGMIEEYSVSMDGVRQDFIIEQRPAGEGPLRVELAVSGAKVGHAASAAELVLEKSGRKIAYSRLRVTDATGKELSARMEAPDKSEIRNPKLVWPSS